MKIRGKKLKSISDYDAVQHMDDMRKAHEKAQKIAKVPPKGAMAYMKKRKAMHKKSMGGT